jgi:hypothetical protein
MATQLRSDAVEDRARLIDELATVRGRPAGPKWPVACCTWYEGRASIADFADETPIDRR